MWHDNDVSKRLNLRYPIIQGPFGGGLSSVELLVAVSDAGGLGSYGAHHLPPAAIGDVARDIRSHTRKPFALNLWVSDHDPGGERLTAEQFDLALAPYLHYYDELGIAAPKQPPARFGERFEDQVQAVLDARPAVFSFVYGIPAAEVLAECRRRDIVTLGTATSSDEAIALERAGVDMVVATGFEAGGHRVSFLREPEHGLMGTFALIPQVVDQVSIPVIAAGGITDGRGVAAAMMLGAQAVQVGTAFLACEESGTHALHRTALFSDQARQTMLTRLFTGRLARGLRSPLVEALQREGVAPLAYPIQRWLTGTFRQAAIAQDRSDLIALWAGQGAPQLHHHHARELFDELVAATSRLLPGSQE